MTKLTQDSILANIYCFKLESGKYSTYSTNLIVQLISCCHNRTERAPEFTHSFLIFVSIVLQVASCKLHVRFGTLNISPDVSPIILDYIKHTAGLCAENTTERPKI